MLWLTLAAAVGLMAWLSFPRGAFFAHEHYDCDDPTMSAYCPPMPPTPTPKPTATPKPTPTPKPTATPTPTPKPTATPTPKPPPPPPPRLPGPVTPFDFKTTHVGETSVKLRWNESSKSIILASISRYRVERSTNGVSWTTVSSSIYALAYTVSGLKKCTTYHFRVSAYGDGSRAAARWSRPSSSLSVKTLGCPPGPVGSLSLDPGNRSLTASWSAPTAGGPVARYEVQHKRASSSWQSGSGDNNGASLTRSITGLTNNVPYDVRVRACNAAGCGAWVSRTAPPTPPTPELPGSVGSLSLVPGDRRLTASWAAPSDGGPVAKYEVQHKLTSSSWPSGAGDDNGLKLSKTIPRLTNDDPYDVRVRACNAAGCGAWVSRTATPRGPTTTTNSSPNFDEGEAATRSVPENSPRGTDIGSPISATDSDNDTLKYSLGGTDAASFRIDSASGQLKTSAALDFETKSSYSVSVSVSDRNGGSDSIAVTINVTDVNEMPTVALDIPDQTMTAGTSTTVPLAGRFSDPDGDSLSYTAHSSDAGVVITSVSGSTLSLASVFAGSATTTVTAADRFSGHADRLSVSVVFAVTVEELPPAVPTNLATTTGDGTITLTWTAGARATSYEVQQLDLQGAPAGFRTLPFRSFTLDSSTTSVTISTTTAKVGGLTNGTLYSHRVRSVNSAGASGWTTAVVTHLPLAKPTILGVEPRPLRRARLKWRGVPNAGSYSVEARDPEARNPAWTPVGTPTCAIPPAQTAELCNIDVKLDSVVNSRGFGYSDAFEFRVKAISTSGTILPAYSEVITIIDNPVLTSGRVSVDNVGEEGRAVLQWGRIPEATDYFVEYRKLGLPSNLGTEGLPHTHEYWPRALGWPYYDDVSASPSEFGAGASDPVWRSVTGLELGELYAFQVNYRTSTTTVYSARNAYVWPSSDYPGNGERVGTYTFFGHHEKKVFEYIICKDTFDDPDTEQIDESDPWVELIKHAFGHWATSTNGFITMTPRVHGVDGWRCSDNTLPIDQFIMEDDERNEVRMFDLEKKDSTIYTFKEMKSDVFKICVDRRPACVTSFTGYAGIDFPDDQRMRIARIVDSTGRPLWLEKALVADILNTHGSQATRQASNTIQSVDINFNRRDPDKPKQPDFTPRMPDKVQFNTCFSGGIADFGDATTERHFFPYATAVHEAGHALGLSNVNYPIFGDVPDDASHPTIPDAAMNYDNRAKSAFPGWGILNPGHEEPDCSPHPFDVMAIFALYGRVP